MNTLQDVREAQQMWESKLKNADREGIELRIRKSSVILTILTSNVNQVTASHVTSGRNLRDGLLQV